MWNLYSSLRDISLELSENFLNLKVLRTTPKVPQTTTKLNFFRDLSSSNNLTQIFHQSAEKFPNSNLQVQTFMQFQQKNAPAEETLPLSFSRGICSYSGRFNWIENNDNFCFLIKFVQRRSKKKSCRAKHFSVAASVVWRLAAPTPTPWMYATRANNSSRGSLVLLMVGWESFFCSRRKVPLESWRSSCAHRWVQPTGQENRQVLGRMTRVG